MDELSVSENNSLVSSSWSSKGDGKVFDLFICSEAGKAIYCHNKTRDESFIVSLMGVCQAMSNFFIDSSGGDSLKCINSKNGLKITFNLKSPLIIIIVTHKLSPIEPSLVIDQVFSQIVSILTLKSLKTVFDFRPTFDLRAVLSRSDNKLLDLLIEESLWKNASCFHRKVKFIGNESDRRSNSIHGYLTSIPTFPSLNNSNQSSSRSSLSGSICLLNNRRVLIPVLPLTPIIRDSITSTIETSVQSVKSEVLFALLFQRKVRPLPSQFYDLNSTQLITVFNRNPKNAKLMPEDIQLLATHVINSDSGLSTAESLWIPICLPHIDSSAFVHCHISYLTSSASSSQTPSPDSTSESQDSEKLCFMLLSVEKDDFHKCQQIKDLVSDRLSKIKLSAWPFSDQLKEIHQLQLFTYFSVKPHAIIYRSMPFFEITNYSPLISYMSWRMRESNFKTFWITCDALHVSLLGSSSAAGLFYFQFDSLITHSEALASATKISNWIKKEEDKIKLRDYQ